MWHTSQPFHWTRRQATIFLFKLRLLFFGLSRLLSILFIRVKCSFCRPSAADPEQAFWVIMAHYRQATFHCYILSCVVSGDKQTTVLISVRRKNTWLEPTESALSFCHWLRPSGPNKVFPFESTAAGDYMGALLRHISAFLGAPFRTGSVWVAASLQCQIWWEPITTSWMHLFHLSACGVYDVCLDLWTRPLCSPDLRPNRVNQSTRGWQFYNTCTMLMGAISHVMIPSHTHTSTRAHTHAHTRTRMHARAHTRAHMRTLTPWFENYRNETKEVNSVLVSPVTSFFLLLHFHK